MPVKPGKPTRPGDSIKKPLPVKPGKDQDRMKKIKMIEDQMKKAQAAKKKKK